MVKKELKALSIPLGILAVLFIIASGFHNQWFGMLRTRWLLLQEHPDQLVIIQGSSYSKQSQTVDYKVTHPKEVEAIFRALLTGRVMPHKQYVCSTNAGGDLSAGPQQIKLIFHHRGRTVLSAVNGFCGPMTLSNGIWMLSSRHFRELLKIAMEGN